MLAYAISAKRYALLAADEDGTPQVLKIFDRDELNDEPEGGAITVVARRSEHGLGHLLNPYDPAVDSNDWIEEAWTWLIAIDLPRETPSRKRMSHAWHRGPHT